MNTPAALRHAYELLQSGQFRQAHDQFLQIWNGRGVTIPQRYTALKGRCAALDQLGQWYLSETVFEDGDRELRLQARDARLLKQVAVGTGVLGFFALLLRRR